MAISTEPHPLQQEFPEEVSSATTGLLIVAGLSAVILVVLLGTAIARMAHAVAQLVKHVLPAPQPKKRAPQPGPPVAAAPPSKKQPQPPPLQSQQAAAQHSKSGGRKGASASSSSSAAAPTHPLYLNTLKGHTDAVHSVAWSTDGTRLLTACDDLQARAFEVTDVTARDPKCQRIKLPKPPVSAAWGAHNIIVALLRGLPDAQLVAYDTDNTNTGVPGGGDPVWAVNGVHGRGEAPLVLAGSPGRGAGGVVVSLSSRKEARLYAGSTGQPLGTLEPNSLANYGLAVSSDGRFVAVASFTAEVKIWELRVASSKDSSIMGAVKAMELKGHKSAVTAVAFSPDARRAVTASRDGTLRVWNIDVRYGQQEDPRTLLVAPQPLAPGRLYQALAYGPGGVIAGVWEGGLHFVSASTGELLDAVPDAHDAPIASLAWCPRLVKTPGSPAPHGVLATASRDKRVRLWRAPAIEARA